ncbi:MAG: HAMP domain-containing histidine kinase [Bacteroidales bacterium]|nr:HAMP domain-containing histidine kinase [Bacteroidales bacterium]
MVRNLLFNACKYGDGSPNILTIDRPVLSVTSSVTSIPEAELKLILTPSAARPMLLLLKTMASGC